MLSLLIEIDTLTYAVCIGSRHAGELDKGPAEVLISPMGDLTDLCGGLLRKCVLKVVDCYSSSDSNYVICEAAQHTAYSAQDGKRQRGEKNGNASDCQIFEVVLGRFEIGLPVIHFAEEVACPLREFLFLVEPVRFSLDFRLLYTRKQLPAQDERRRFRLSRAKSSVGSRERAFRYIVIAPSVSPLSRRLDPIFA